MFRKQPFENKPDRREEKTEYRTERVGGRSQGKRDRKLFQP